MPEAINDWKEVPITDWKEVGAPVPPPDTLWDKVKTVGEEPFKLAGEAITAPINSIQKGLKGIGGAAITGYNLATGQGLDKSLQAGAQHINTYDPIRTPQSETSKFIGNKVIQPAVKTLGDFTGQPELVQAGVEGAGDIAALFGIKPGLKFAKAAIPATVKDFALNAGSSVKNLPEVLYKSSLKPTTSAKVSLAEINNRVKTGLQGGYLPNKESMARLYDNINDLNSQISDVIGEASIKGKIADTAPLQAELSTVQSSLDLAKSEAAQNAADRVIASHMIKSEGTHWMQKNNVSDQMYKANIRKAYGELPAERQIQGGIPATENITSPMIENLKNREAQLKDAISNVTETGQTVKVDDILARLDEVKQRARDSFGDNAPALKAIRGFEKSLRNHPDVVNGEIPIALAQRMKVNTYQQLKNSYGELKGFEIEAKKAMARGIKEEIVKLAPEIAELNAKDSALINFEKTLAQATKRITNRDVINFGGPAKIASGALVDMAGGHGLGVMTGAALWALDNPVVKAKLAIVLHKARTKAGIQSDFGETVRQLNTIRDTMKAKDAAIPAGAGAISNAMLPDPLGIREQQ